MSNLDLKQVVGAAVVDSLAAPTKMLAARRTAPEQFAGMWEFPGGKVEPGEAPQDALVREIREELATDIRVERYVTTVEWDYPSFHLSMRCYLCSVVSGSLTLLEHEAAAWLDKEHLRSVEWLPADSGIIPEIESLLEDFSGNS